MNNIQHFLPVISVCLVSCGSIAPEQGRERTVILGIGLVDRVIAAQPVQYAAPQPAALPTQPTTRNK